MKALLWKDYRVNRQVLIMGLFLLVAPYLAVLSYLGYSEGLFGAAGNVWGAFLLTGARASLVVSQLTIVILGGHIIAGERRDRSAEFLAYLPPSRPAILRSKTLLAAATFAVIWGLYLCIGELIAPMLSGSGNAERAQGDFSDSRNILIAIGVAMFGMAWLGSSMLESPTYSMAIGVAAAIVAPLALNTCRYFTGAPETAEDFVLWVQILYFAFGGCGFLLGWWWYVRRVEP